MQTGNKKNYELDLEREKKKVFNFGRAFEVIDYVQ